MSSTIPSAIPKNKDRMFAQAVRRKEEPTGSSKQVDAFPTGCDCCHAILAAYHGKEKELKEMEVELKNMKHQEEWMKNRLRAADENNEEERERHDGILDREREAHNQMVSTLRADKDKLIKELRVVKDSSLHYKSEMSKQKWPMEKLNEELNKWREEAEKLQKQVDRLQSQLNNATPKDVLPEMNKTFANLQTAPSLETAQEDPVPVSSLLDILDSLEKETSSDEEESSSSDSDEEQYLQSDHSFQFSRLTLEDRVQIAQRCIESSMRKYKMPSSSSPAPKSNTEPANIGNASKLSGPAMTCAFVGYILEPLLLEIDSDTLTLYSSFQLDTDGQDFIREIYKESGNALRMYGTIDELAGQIKIFRNFSRSHQFFELSDSDVYSTVPITYTSLSQQTYMCKNDAFVELQKIVRNNYEPYQKLPIVRCLVTMFLRLHEEKLEFVNQFVNTSNTNFKSMEDEFNTLISKNKPKTMRLLAFTREEILGHYKKLIPREWDSEGCEVFEELLRSLTEKYPVRVYPKRYKKLYSQLAAVLDCLNSIMKKRPEIFLPGSNTAHTIIRVFQDGTKQFVPTDEIPEHLGTFEKSDQEDIWLTTDLSNIPKSVLKKSEDPDFKIQFIKVPIVRAKHRACYIMDRNAEFHTLASDAFFEMIFNWIFGLKVFQRIQTKDDWKFVETFLETLQGYFDWKRKNVYFLANFAIKEVDDLCAKYFEGFVIRPAKDVRNVKATGFTEEDLKDELTHLGLTTAFPEIHDHVKKVYDHVLKEKKGNVLRTCDLFDAVHQCQMISFFKKFPQFTKFIHNQNGCSRVVFTYCECRAEQSLRESFERNGLPGFVDENCRVIFANMLPYE